MLAVGGLAAAALAQQDDGLVLASGEQVPIGGLSHAVDVGRRVLPPAALEHLHHLGTEEKSRAVTRVCYHRWDCSVHPPGAAYLLRVHGGRANGVNDHHVGPGVGVHQVAAVALPQGVHHAGLVQVLQRGQVLHAVEHGRVGLRFRVGHAHVLSDTDCGPQLDFAD